MDKDLTATTLNSFRRRGLTQAAFLLPYPSSYNFRSCQRCGKRRLLNNRRRFHSSTVKFVGRVVCTGDAAFR